MLSWNESSWFAMLLSLALKSSIVLAVAWLPVTLLRRHSAAVRHLVWTAVAVALLALPALSISLPPWRVAAPAALALNTGLLIQTTATGHSDTISAAHITLTQEPVPAPSGTNWRRASIWIWVLGSLAAFGQMLAACASIWRLRRSAQPSAEVPLSNELAHSLGIRRAVKVLETSEGTMPMTFGILSPAVFLPCDASQWTEERRRIVLLHELAHVRRGDAATNLLARLALILNWWNPLAWIAWREFLKERERATDDLVLQTGARASEYATHLFEVARSMRRAPASGFMAVAMARPSQLEGRLLAILDSDANRKSPGWASASAAMLVAVAMIAPLAAIRAQDSAAQAVPTDVEATIRAGVAQNNPEMLEKPASAFANLQQFDSARKLLDSATAIRQQVSGSQSVDYGLGLMKIADLEKRRNHAEEAQAFYSKALQILGDRPETAPALMYLGMLMKDSADSFSYFQRVQRADSSLAGPATMWMALIRERDKRPAEAEELYRSALAMENPVSVEAASTMELFARFLKDQGRDDEGLPMLERARVILYGRGPGQGALQTPSTIVFAVGDGVTNPAVLYKRDPEYSVEARFAKFSGTVVCYVEIAPDGTAQNIQVKTGVGLGLDEKAVEAITKWRFKPGTKNGLPVAVKANIEVNFKML